jgi:hypothetical protein
MISAWRIFCPSGVGGALQERTALGRDLHDLAG